jgi:hypothetical protein
MWAQGETSCPELARLRGEAAEASKQMTRDPVSIRCGSYHRIARATEAIVNYVNGNRESCGVLDQSLEEIERRHRNAVLDRDNFCAGRPLRPLPLLVLPR